jgi:YVTN family beta-propeller protein
MWWRASPSAESARAHAEPRRPRLFVANRLDDTISVIDTRTNRWLATIKLDGPKTKTDLRLAPRRADVLHRALLVSGPDRLRQLPHRFHLRRLTWNLEPDGFGRSIVDNKLLEGIKDTEPYKWTGTNPNIPTECGPRTEKYFWRSENYDNLTLADLSLHSQPSAAAQSLAARRRTYAGAGAGQGDL